MKLKLTGIYAIIATIALILLLFHVKQSSEEYQRLTEELNDYQVERGKVMQELKILTLKRDSLFNLYLESRAEIPDIGAVQDEVRTIYITERNEVVILDANATVERLRWVWDADSLLIKKK